MLRLLWNEPCKIQGIKGGENGSAAQVLKEEVNEQMDVQVENQSIREST